MFTGIENPVLINKAQSAVRRTRRKLFPEVKGWTTQTLEWEDGSFEIEEFHTEDDGKRIEVGYFKGDIERFYFVRSPRPIAD